MPGSTWNTWGALPPELRSDLEAILAAHRQGSEPLAARFLDDSDELMPFVGLGLAAAWVCAAVCGWLALGEGGPGDPGLLVRLEPAFTNPVAGLPWLATRPEGGLLLSSAVGLALTVFWLRHRGRRGMAITDRALVVVRGPRVKVLAFGEIAGCEQTAHGKPGKRFTALRLRMNDGTTEQLLVSKRWADAAEGEIARWRSQGGVALPRGSPA